MRVWSDFEFIVDDGTINEMDALVLTRRGFVLVEITSGPGTIEGDGYNWTWREGARPGPMTTHASGGPQHEKPQEPPPAAAGTGPRAAARRSLRQRSRAWSRPPCTPRPRDAMR